MSRTPKAYGGTDIAVVRVLARLLDESGQSLRATADMAEMSHNRLGKILREETPPPTVGEVDRISRALGTAASAVFAHAERLDAIAGDYPVVSIPDWRMSDPGATIAPDNFTLAAHDHRDYEVRDDGTDETEEG